MNRRKLLAAGVGLGTLGLISKSSQAGSDDETDVKSDFAGPVYCPVFPYMFCGSYTLYYAVQNNNGACGANPASMAGPNGLACGCPGASCVATIRRDEARTITALVGDSTHAHKSLGKLGMKKRPNKKLTFASGANTVGSGAGGDSGHIVIFKDSSGQDRIVRVYQVDITASQIDREMLIELGIDPAVVSDKTFYVGHEDTKATGEIVDDPNATGVRDQKHTYRVTANIDGNATEFLVVMKRP